MVDFPEAPNKLFTAFQAQVEATKNAKPGGPAPAPGGPDPKVEGLEKDMKAVQAQLDQLLKAPVIPGDLVDRVSKLETQLTGVVEKDVPELRERLDKVEQQLRDLPKDIDSAIDAALKEPREHLAKIDGELADLHKHFGKPWVLHEEFDEFKRLVDPHLKAGFKTSK